MIRRVDLRGQSLTKSEINSLIPRAKLDVVAAMAAIEPILETVRTGTEADLISFGVKFDGVAPKAIRVPKSELTNALNNLDPAVRESLEIAAVRIRKVHQDQIRETKISEVEPGATITETTPKLFNRE